MSEQALAQIPPLGEQAIHTQLDNSPIGRRKGESENGSNILAHSTLDSNRYADGDKTWEQSSQSSTTAKYGNRNEQSVSGVDISHDESVRHQKGSLLPPKLPSKRTESSDTRAQVYDIHSDPADEAGMVDVLRKASVSTRFDEEGSVAKRTGNAVGVKKTTHAPRGQEGQEYHVRFNDEDRRDRYGELVMKLAAKRMNQAVKDTSAIDSEGTKRKRK